MLYIHIYIYMLMYCIIVVYCIVVFFGQSWISGDIDWDWDWTFDRPYFFLKLQPCWGNGHCFVCRWWIPLHTGKDSTEKGRRCWKKNCLALVHHTRPKSAAGARIPIYSTYDSSTLSMFAHVCAQWFIVLDRFVKVTACQSIQDHICKAQMAIPRSDISSVRKVLAMSVQCSLITQNFVSLFYLFAAVCTWYKGDKMILIIMLCTSHKAGTTLHFVYQV